MARSVAALRTTCLRAWLSSGTNTIRSPSTSQPQASRRPFVRGCFSQIVRLAAVGRRQMVGRGCDPVLRENALLDGDLALAARLAAAADGLDLDAQHAGGIEQIRAGRDLALAAGRLKNNSAGRWVGLLAHGLVV